MGRVGIGLLEAYGRYRLEGGRFRAILERIARDEIYCPCNVLCHRRANPCSLGCILHDGRTIRMPWELTVH